MRPSVTWLILTIQFVLNDETVVNSIPLPLLFRHFYTQVLPSGESFRVMWPSCGLKLASPVLRNLVSAVGDVFETVNTVAKYRGADKSLARPGRKQVTSMSKSSWMMDLTRSREMPSCSAIDLNEIRRSSEISSWIWSIISGVVGLRTYQRPGTVIKPPK
jgi:hypothetical protein